MNETILTWNFTNWATVVIMVAIGFVILRTVATFFGGGVTASGDA